MNHEETPPSRDHCGALSYRITTHIDWCPICGALRVNEDAWHVPPRGQREPGKPMMDGACTCDQHGDYCPAHPTCACGCQKHAHRGGPCLAGKMSCHGCDGYRPATLKRFHELDDEDVDHATLDELRIAYKGLRTHHVEETTALWARTAK